MTGTDPINIEAVAGISEKHVFAAAMEQLVESLHATSGTDWVIRLSFCSELERAGATRPDVVIVSLLPAVTLPDDMPSTAQRLRSGLARIVELGTAATFLTTAFRHIAGRAEHSDRAGAIIERIRRLNLLAIELSHEFGVNIIDIDRVLTFYGGRKLHTDYRLGGRLAAEVAGYAIVRSILAAGMDEKIPPDIQEGANRFQGDLSDIDKLLLRRRKTAQRQAG